MNRFPRPSHPINHRARLLTDQGLGLEETTHELNITVPTLVELIEEHPDIVAGRNAWIS